jgi:hypothetical protein
MQERMVGGRHRHRARAIVHPGLGREQVRGGIVRVSRESAAMCTQSWGISGMCRGERVAVPIELSGPSLDRAEEHGGMERGQSHSARGSHS